MNCRRAAASRRGGSPYRVLSGHHHYGVDQDRQSECGRCAWLSCSKKLHNDQSVAAGDGMHQKNALRMSDATPASKTPSIHLVSNASAFIGANSFCMSCRKLASISFMAGRKVVSISFMSCRKLASISFVSCRKPTSISFKSRLVATSTDSCAPSTTNEIASACGSDTPAASRVFTNFKVSNATAPMVNSPVLAILQRLTRRSRSAPQSAISCATNPEDDGEPPLLRAFIPDACALCLSSRGKAKAILLPRVAWVLPWQCQTSVAQTRSRNLPSANRVEHHPARQGQPQQRRRARAIEPLWRLSIKCMNTDAHRR